MYPWRDASPIWWSGCDARVVRVVVAAFAALCALYLVSPRAVALDEAQALFAANKQRVCQVRVLDLGSGSKSGIGSGFWVTADGYVVTNFHVVSDLVHKAGQHRAEYLLEGGRRGDLELVDIDVVNDLAVLKSDHQLAEFLELEQRAPANGERLFAMGNPHDLGLSIVEGTYNGLIEESLYEKIHFTGALNPGMSGGPTINRAGRVVGVNVATGGNQLGFLVPVKHVARLLERATSGPPLGQASYAGTVAQQLFDNQAQYMREMIARLPIQTTRMNGFSVPGQLTPYFKCWGDTDTGDKQLYTRTAIACYTDDDIYLTEDHEVGEVQYFHEYFTTRDMGSLSFAAFLEERLNDPRLSIGTDENMVGNYRCRTRLVSSESLRFKLVFCVRQYQELEALYDAFMTAVTRVGAGEALQTSFTLSGVGYENILGFLEQYLKAVRWLQ